MNESQRDVVRCCGIYKTFTEGPSAVPVLEGVDLAVVEAEQVAIVGRSGSGKSTLLHILGGLDVPGKGDVWIAGQAINKLDNRTRGRLRNKALGFIYQFHHLLAEFTAAENVAMPLLIGGATPAAAVREATRILGLVGLENRVEHKPAELSGGERQRVAIARALVTRPRCVLADEPTGNLDRQTAEHVFGLLRDLNRSYGTSVVMVTHDLEMAQRMDRVLHLEDGRLNAEDAAVTVGPLDERAGSDMAP